LLDDILRRGFDGQQILSGLALFFRDLLVCRDPQTIVLFEASETVREKYLTLAAQCQQNFLYKAMELTNETDLSYRLSKNKRFAIELLLVRLCQQTTPSTEVEDEKKKLKPIIADSEQQSDGRTQTDAEKKSATAQTGSIASSASKSTVKSSAPKPTRISIRDWSKNTPDKSASEQGKDVIRTEASSTQPDAVFSQQQLTEAWNNFASDVADAYLKNSMPAISPVLKDDFVVEVAVVNPSQQEVFASASPEISRHLRSALGNNAITISLVMRETQDADIKAAYTDKDKMARMAESNSDLINFARELDLRLGK
jgi:DNA polymerase-3 subunit gamma/tau